MDDYFFEPLVRVCTAIEGPTSFLEIYNYSDGESYCKNTVLPNSEFQDFLDRKGKFAPPELKPGVTILSGMRLVLQLGEKRPDKFAAQHISLTHQNYIDMVRKFNLPFPAIEGTSVSGPFFWSALDQDNANPHLKIIFRKSDELEEGYTQGWELMLSHDFRSAITTGYAKSIQSSQLFQRIIEHHLCNCAASVGHPLLLPSMIMSHELNSTMDNKQREARYLLRKLEYDIAGRSEIDETGHYLDLDLDNLNNMVVECHNKVLWKRPQPFLDILDEFDKVMGLFSTTRGKLLEHGRLHPHRADAAVEMALDNIHCSVASRFDFLRQKLKGYQHNTHTAIERIGVHRDMLSFMLASRESTLNFDVAQQQRLLGLVSRRDNKSMKALSVLGAIFLPATYLASLFSMTFFDFQPDRSGGSTSNSTSSDDDAPMIAPTLWIYFAVAIPLTLTVLGVLFWWQSFRSKKLEDEENRAMQELPEMERRVRERLREKWIERLNLQPMDRWELTEESQRCIQTRGSQEQSDSGSSD